MPLVRFLKSVGFEQTGDIADYRGNVEEALERGEIELLEADPRLPVTSETATEVEQPVEEKKSEEEETAETTEAPVTEPTVEPVVEGAE